MKTVTFTKIINCACCSGTHEKLDFMPLTRPVMMDDTVDEEEYVLYTHWHPCPTNGEPILGLVTE